jgi:hypothetical protein
LKASESMMNVVISEQYEQTNAHEELLRTKEYSTVNT